LENENFYLLTGNTSKLEFQLLAEGLRKSALLWLLIKNATLVNGSILFWDEPEANINPVQIPVIVDILLDLQRDGVQVFLSTHDYFFAKYLEVKRSADNDILFHVLYKKNAQNSAVMHNSAETFSLLEENSIIKQFNYSAVTKCRSQWPHRLRRGSVAVRLLRLWVRIAPGAWISVLSVVR
jgi:wobble nucleotide-excising tRNase